MNSPSPEYIRLCPSCGNENEASVMRCGCGAMLFGLDLVKRQAAAAQTEDASPAGTAKETVTCPYEDCEQENPVGTQTCVYCNRALASGVPLPATQSLINLPQPLQARYRIVRNLPASGAEADILLVEPSAGGEQRIVKLYRQGIQPHPEVQERIARIASQHRVQMIESGRANGYAYEVMEFCAFGSLRERMGTPWPADAFEPVVAQLVTALTAVHDAGIVHRDIKPDNVLVRSRKPLDLVLTDFSIASALNTSQCFTSMARTLHYASPESLSGVLNGKADYWSLGMLLFEAAQGKHPFAGLSDAVILHHLTTRSMDLGAIADTRLRTLLRGLLIRDPKQRWGNVEVQRWLAGDTALTAPRDDIEDSFAQPYSVEGERCRTKEQLAIAFSRNWSAGLSDLNNAQLLRWFRDVQKDQDVVRLLLDMQGERVHADVQLLRLLLHLAPGMPAVWRGESIELRAILARANLALKGDADAARWLDNLYTHRVLGYYAAAGHPEAAELSQRWTSWAGKFNDAWDAQQKLLKSRAPVRDPNSVVLFDDVVFGNKPQKYPSLLPLHPRLLAMAYDPNWAERLRQHLVAEHASLSLACPWLNGAGDPSSMNPAELLAFEMLLPEARQVIEKEQRNTAQKKQTEEAESQTLRSEAGPLLTQLRNAASGSLSAEANRLRLRETLDEYFRILADLREAAQPGPEWERLKKLYDRSSPVAMRILEALDNLEERMTANEGWLSIEALGAAVSLIFMSAYVGGGLFWLAVLCVVGLAAWRLLPPWLIRNDIRALAARL